MLSNTWIGVPGADPGFLERGGVEPRAQLYIYIYFLLQKGGGQGGGMGPPCPPLDPLLGTVLSIHVIIYLSQLHVVKERIYISFRNDRSCLYIHWVPLKTQHTIFTGFIGLKLMQLFQIWQVWRTMIWYDTCKISRKNSNYNRKVLIFVKPP